MKFLTPLLFIALAIFVFYWYVSPDYDEVKAYRVELDKNVQALDRVKTASATWNTLVNKEMSISPADMDKLTKMLPDERADVIQLILEITNVASKYNAKISNVNVTPSSADTTQSQFGVQPIGFSVSLSYDNFLSFMKDLEKTLKLFDTTSVSFQPSDKSSTYDYSVNLKTYWLKTSQ